MLDKNCLKIIQGYVVYSQNSKNMVTTETRIEASMDRLKDELGSFGGLSKQPAVVSFGL